MKWESSSNYSRDDMIRMQQDAVERVREMQRRSDAALKNAQRNPAFFTSSAPNPGVPIQQVHNQQNSSSHKRVSSVEKQAESLTSSEAVQHGQSSQEQPQPQVQPPTPNQSQGGETPPPPTQPQPENNMGQQRNYTMPQEQPSSPLQNFLGQTPLAGIGKGVESLLGTLTGPSNPQKKDTIAQLLEVLHLDGERILILMIILLLYNDGADYTLLFALLYLFI